MPAVQRLAPDEHVGRRRSSVVEQVEFLVHEGDAGGASNVGRPTTRRSAGRRHGCRTVTESGFDHAAEDLHQRRLARAVFSDQADHLAGATVMSKPASATTPG